MKVLKSGEDAAAEKLAAIQAIDLSTWSTSAIAPDGIVCVGCGAHVELATEDVRCRSKVPTELRREYEGETKVVRAVAIGPEAPVREDTFFACACGAENPLPYELLPGAVVDAAVARAQAVLDAAEVAAKAAAVEAAK